MKSPVDKVHKISYVLNGEIHLYVCLSAILIEEARTLLSFFKYVLEKTKATKKQLKRSKSKKVKEANLLY